jgi:hypothetical protein
MSPATEEVPIDQALEMGMEMRLGFFNPEYRVRPITCRGRALKTKRNQREVKNICGT